MDYLALFIVGIGLGIAAGAFLCAITGVAPFLIARGGILVILIAVIILLWDRPPRR